MQLKVQPDGTVHGVYQEDLDFASLGRLEIRRGSHVEPDPHAFWEVDLSPVGGPMLGPFPQRSEALQAEQEWLETFWLSALLRV